MASFFLFDLMEFCDCALVLSLSAPRSQSAAPFTFLASSLCRGEPQHMEEISLTSTRDEGALLLHSGAPAAGGMDGE